MTLKAELVVDAKVELGEGALWDEQAQVLYWVDILGSKLFVYNPATGENTAYDVGQHVGTVVLRQPGGVMLAVRNGFARFDLDTSTLDIVADPESDKTENRFNDGKCDPAGRFWAGTMSYSQSLDAGSLYRLDSDLSVHKMIDGVTISNGIVWTSDHKTMYYIDTTPRTVVAYDYDNATGNISNLRTVINVPEEYGPPDGMAIDSEGMLWVAHFSGSAVRRWNPSTGEMLEVVELPTSSVTSCAFGGENLDELYITTARIQLSDEQLELQPLAGGLFKVKVGIKGTTTYRFDG
jgi:sugar lactone lactonase YvrE